MADLRVITPRLTLRYPDDELAAQLAALAANGVHDPSTMPFTVPWTDAPRDELPLSSLQHFWRQRAELTRDSWHLPLAVVVDDEVVGVQAIIAERFAILRAVSTGSWLGIAHHGNGIGTEMREAVLHLAFVGLGATHAHSGAFADNTPSLRVSAKLGYREEGRRRVVRRGEPATLIGLQLERADWERARRDDSTIEGLDRCLPLLGAT